VILAVELDGDTATGWDAVLTKYLDRWPVALPVAEGGRGSISESTAPPATAAPAGDPAPSSHPGR